MSHRDVIYNESLLQKLEDPATKTKTAELIGGYLRDKIREASWIDKIIPPEGVTRADCQISLTHDTLLKVVHIEPGSRAMTVTIRGRPDSELISGKRFAVTFGRIATLRYEKPKEELLVYDYPITKVIEDNSVKDMDAIKDRTGLVHFEAAVQALQLESNGGAATELSSDTVQAGTVVQRSAFKGELASLAASPNSSIPLPIQKMDIVRLFQTFPDRSLSGARMLIHDSDLLTVFSWPYNEVGPIATETTIEGYKHPTLAGYDIVRSLKPEVLRPGNVYGFVAPEFLGVNYTLGQTSFYIDTIENMVIWLAWAMVGMGIGMVEGVRKMELYPCDATPGSDAQGLIGNVTPLEEKNMSAVNNRLDDGLVFPRITQF
jgi:hypothetical protein